MGRDNFRGLRRHPYHHQHTMTGDLREDLLMNHRKICWRYYCYLGIASPWPMRHKTSDYVRRITHDVRSCALMKAVGKNVSDLQSEEQ